MSIDFRFIILTILISFVRDMFLQLWSRINIFNFSLSSATSALLLRVTSITLRSKWVHVFRVNIAILFQCLHDLNFFQNYKQIHNVQILENQGKAVPIEARHFRSHFPSFYITRKSSVLSSEYWVSESPAAHVSWAVCTEYLNPLLLTCVLSSEYLKPSSPYCWFLV